MQASIGNKTPGLGSSKLDQNHRNMHHGIPNNEERDYSPDN
jgi:hypothetical protein